MVFVRKRTTKAGNICASLVESYRDTAGRPRQRVLANLYGAATLPDALAKLAAQRELLQKEKAWLKPELEAADTFYRTVTTAALEGRRYPAERRKEIYRLLTTKRERLIARGRKADADLARIQKDGAVIQKHCTASPDEVQAAIRRYKKELAEAEAMMVGAEHVWKMAKSELRRLSL